MDRFDRIFRLHQLLAGRRTPVSGREIEQQLECSRATRNRCIEDMRDYLGAPIVYDRERDGYRYDSEASAWELPGLWLQPGEMQALLLMQQLMRELQPGLLGDPLAPLQKRLGQLMERSGISAAAADRIRIFNQAGRPVSPKLFNRLVEGLSLERRLDIDYLARSSGERSQRQVSPLKMVFYRGNWYLDGWCHLREALRSFSVDSMQSIEITEQAAKPVDEADQLAHYAGAYGIFSGAANQIATVEFSPRLARWVADEQWHPEQQGQFVDSGRYRLDIPYGDPTELIMDLLRYGGEVEVLSPPQLREQMRLQIDAMAAIYQ